MVLSHGMSPVRILEPSRTCTTRCCVFSVQKSKDFVKKVFDKLTLSLYNT